MSGSGDDERKGLSRVFRVLEQQMSGHVCKEASIAFRVLARLLRACMGGC